MKRLLSALTVILTLTILSACGGNDRPAAAKSFTRDGMSITLTANFSEYRGEEARRFNAAYMSEKDKVVIMILKEDMGMFRAAGVSTEISLTEYAQLVIDASPHTTRVVERDGLTTFTYTNNNNRYFSVVFRCDDAYWLVQFSAAVSDFDRNMDNFIKWAKTARFTPTQAWRDAVNEQLNPTKQEVFAVEELRITLTENFEPMEDSASFIQALLSEKDVAIVMFTREGFDLFEQLGVPTDLPLRDYAAANAAGIANAGEITEEGGLTSFTYSNDTHTYLVTVFRSGSAYWMVQFTTFNANFESQKGDFIEWAKTIRFEG
jgi:hypothetical protein